MRIHFFIRVGEVGGPRVGEWTVALAFAVRYPACRAPTPSCRKPAGSPTEALKRGH